MTDDKRTGEKQTESLAETLSDDALDEVHGGARTPAHTPEFTNPNVGDPGRTLSRAVSTRNLTLKRS